MFILFSVLLFRYAFVQCAVDGNMIWDKSRQEFVDLYSVPRFVGLRERALARDGDFNAEYINGKVLKASYYEDGDLVSFYENDTKVSGIYGEIWNLLADHLNFTLIPIKYEKRDFGIRLENGSYTGLMGLLQRNEAHIILRTGYYTGRASLLDYTTPVSHTQYQLYIKPEYKHSNTWIIMVFERRIWYILLFMFLVLSLAGYVLQNKQHRNSRKTKREQAREHFTLIDHVFYTYSIMCSQGHIPNSYHSQTKILSLSKSVFAWLILLSFSSDLIYQMTNRVMTLPFKNFDTLLNKTNYDVLVFKGSMIYEFVKAGVERSRKLSKRYDVTKRIHFIEDSNMMHKTVCHSEKKYAMLETEDKVFMKNRHVCHVIPVGDNYFQSWIGFALPKRFPYKKVINVSILKLHEFGLIDVLKDRWFKHRIKYEQKKTFKTIDMEQVYLILCIPFVGIALSLVVLFLEKAISFCENNSKRLT